MEYIDKNGVTKKVPTINPTYAINRFEGQSKLAKYLNNHFVNRMDAFTSVRSIFLLSILVFTLGNNLNHYLICLFFIHTYLLMYRVIRFWIERWLMFMIDYCYIGNILLIYFNLFDRNNMDIFLGIYGMTSGVVSLAVIVCDNQLDLTNTDFLTSCSIHVLPVTTMWAVRWKHFLYDNYEEYKNTIVDTENIKFQFDDIFIKLVTYPFYYWIGWAFIYFILNTKILRKYAYSDLYESAIGDFYKSNEFSCIFGDHTKNTTIKYLLMHLMFMILVLPVSVFNFYNFYWNTLYLIFIVFYIGYNQAKKRRKALSEIVKKAEDIRNN